jgi:Fe-S-cluster containining protein
MAQIKTLRSLYLFFDDLYYGIERNCLACKDDCCLGYVWLLPREVEMTINSGVEVLEVNSKLFFINSFSRGGKIDIEQFKPRCPLFKKGRCAIYEQRPLSCRMYPLSFFPDGDKLQLVLHLDCRFSRLRREDPAFQKNVLAFFSEMSQTLLREIIETYKKVFNITKFPKGRNSYILLGTLPPLRERR